MAREEGVHGSPPSELECLCCMEDIDEALYVEYQCCEDGPWKPALFCADCIDDLLDTQWDLYQTKIAQASCQAELRRLLDKGPPVNLSDATALPCEEGDGEVHQLWFARDKKEKSAKLKGSLVGAERQEWWDYQKTFDVEEGEQEQGQGQGQGQGQEQAQR